MGKKLGLSSLLFKLKDTSRPSCYSSPSHSSSWPWPSCKDPKTNSFRDATDNDAIFKTVNSVYFDSAESCFTHSTSEEPESLSTISEEYYSAGGGDSNLEKVVRGLRSDRLFFEPGRDTSSILEEAKAGSESPFKESVVMAMESNDPYRDFRLSMEEMVVAHGLKDWEKLEELLLWYLKVNGKKTHGLIVGAFVDLLVGLASPTSPSSSPSSSSPSSSSNNNVSFEIEEIDEKEEGRISSS